MRDLYVNPWADIGCLGAALGVSAIALTAVGCTLWLIWLVVRAAHRRDAEAALAADEEPEDTRIDKVILLGSALATVVILAVTLFTGATLHRATLADGELRLAHCVGATVRNTATPVSAITGASVRVEPARARSSEPTDLLLLHRADAEPIEIPLRANPDILDPDILKDFVAPEVLKQWEAVLVARGKRLPPVYRVQSGE